VSETDSYAILQYLPENQKNYLKMSNGIVNILPRKFLLKEYKNHGVLNLNEAEIENLPFEDLKNRTMEKHTKQHTIKEHHSHRVIEDTEKIYHVEEFPFNHAICILEVKGNDELINFAKIYDQMIKYLAILWSKLSCSLC